MANTIQDKLAYLEETKGLIKEAIVAKGVEVTDTDTFRSYADKIEAIQAGGSIAGAPSGIKFANSEFTTVPVEIFPYLEAQTDLSYIFQSCNSLQTVPQFDTKKATTMEYMFTLCGRLQTVSQLNTVNVTTMKGMFQACRSLQIAPQLNTKKVTDTSWMFRECENLQTAPQLNTVNVTTMKYMFQSCDSLQTAPQLNTVNVTTMDSMFAYCFSLQTVPQLDTSSVTNMGAILWSCKKLTNLGGFTGLKVNLDLSSSPLLTVDSVMNVINNAANMASSPKTLTLHKDVFNKLTQEQIATATAKGWNIAVG